ncbi:MAG: hypothetical protein ACTSRP_09740 [Candidatus Helarchaeota archaeon]
MFDDEEFLKKLIETISNLMTPEGQRKIREMMEKYPDIFKNFPMVNMSPSEIQKFIDQINSNPNIKIDIKRFPGGIFPIPSSVINNSASNRVTDQNEGEKIDPECFWVDDEYHIIFNYPEDNLKFRTAVHKRDKSKIILRIIDSEGRIIKRVRLPPIVYYKKLYASYNNGIYEIVYKKAE